MRSSSKMCVFFSILLLFGFSTQLFAKEHPAPKPAKKILLVLTSVETIPGIQRPTGFWAEEFAVPIDIFKTAGYQVVAGSVKGGKAPIDPASVDPKVIGEAQEKNIRELLEKHQEFKTCVPLKNLKTRDFIAVFVVGGHGVMWDLTGNSEFKRIVIEAVSKKIVISSVCHGPGAFLKIVLPNGNLFLAGKKVTGFSAKEEELGGMTKIVPYCLEEELSKETGGKYSKGVNPWESFSVTDNLIITGQNPSSSAETAKNVVKRLNFLKISR